MGFTEKNSKGCVYSCKLSSLRARTLSHHFTLSLCQLPQLPPSQCSFASIPSKSVFVLSLYFGHYSLLTFWVRWLLKPILSMNSRQFMNLLFGSLVHFCTASTKMMLFQLSTFQEGSQDLKYPTVCAEWWPYHISLPLPSQILSGPDLPGFLSYS